MNHPPLERAQVTIIGAGPTGPGAAHRLHELSHRNLRVYDTDPYAGGLAVSLVDTRTRRIGFAGGSSLQRDPVLNAVLPELERARITGYPNQLNGRTRAARVAS